MSLLALGKVVLNFWLCLHFLIHFWVRSSSFLGGVVYIFGKIVFLCWENCIHFLSDVVFIFWVMSSSCLCKVVFIFGVRSSSFLIKLGLHLTYNQNLFMDSGEICFVCDTILV